MSSNKTYFYLSLTLFAVIFFTAISFPIKYLLDNVLPDHQSSFIAGAFTRILIIFFLWKILLSSGLTNFTRIGYKVKDAYPLIFPLIIIGLKLFFDFDLSILRNPYFLIFIFSSLIIGFAEELSFRGVILPLLIKKTNNIFISAVLSSIPFALFHYVNLSIEPGNFGGVTSQVIFAFVIGIFFSGIFLRTENIIITALVHTSINIAFTNPESFKPGYTEIMTQAGESNFSLSIFTWIAFSIILAGSLFTLSRVNRTRILSLLDSAKSSN